jgi:hypothetical protein
MSVRKRCWRTSKGEERHSWVVDYVDQEGRHHIETFDKKKDADGRHAQVNVSSGIRVAPSKSKRVREAGESRIKAAESGDADNEPLERSTIGQYRQHLRTLAQWFMRDVIAHNACEKRPAFCTDETDFLEKLGQFAWRVEVPYGIREVANTLHALGGTPEKLGRKPYREAQVDEVRHLDDPRRRAEHITMAEDATRFENPIDLLERSDELEMARCKLERHGIE